MRLEVSWFGCKHTFQMRQAGLQVAGFDQRLSEDKLSHRERWIVRGCFRGVVERGGIVALKLKGPGEHGVCAGVVR
jgi:hypothetical protein